MINSNYQCQHTITHFDKNDVKIGSWQKSQNSAMNRCFPHDHFQKIQAECSKMNPGERMEWKFLESRNGEPFYELINEKNACLLTYKPFSHNSWIKYPDKSLIKGYPYKNTTLNEIGSNGLQISNVPIYPESDSTFKTHYDYWLLFYKALWSIAFLYFLAILFFRKKFKSL